MTTIETTLVHPDPAKPRFYHLELDGRRLISRAWSGTGRGRQTVKELGDVSDHSAKLAFMKLRDRKMREGFCYRVDAETASRGDVVLEFRGLDNSKGDAFDLSPDGRVLAYGRMLDGAYGAEILVMDIATGHRRRVHVIPSRSGDQTFLHAVLFHPDGRRIIYAVENQTRLFDPDTGEDGVLAEYKRWNGTNFNPFRLQPVWNRDRSRLLLFDADNRIKVLDTELSTVFDTRVSQSDGFECHAAAVSPSGRLLSLSLSKGSVYDEADPAVTHLEVWDIDTAELRNRFPVGRPVDSIGFDPTEELLITNPDYANGPCAFRIESGSMVWYFPDPGGRTDRWDTCYAWDYSPDGTELAVGRRGGADVVDAKTRERDPVFERPWPQFGGVGRAYGVQISADGRLLVTGGDAGRIMVHRL